MSTLQLHWDLLLPQGANLELAGLTAGEGWSLMLSAGAEAERLGYDSVWTLDRLETLPRREPQPVFDGWTALGALSQRTKRVKLGQLGVGAPVRDVAQLAKSAACLDVISGGRMMLGVDAFGYPSEHEAHGQQVPDSAAMPEATAETVQTLRQLWGERAVSVHGKHVRLSRVFSEPKPLAGRPGLHLLDDPACPVLDRIDPRLVDGLIWHGTPAQVRAGVDRLAERCAAAGDDPDRIERTVLLECRVFDTVAARDKWLATPYVVIFWSEHPDLYMQRNAVGTVAAVRTMLHRYVEAGATRFMVWFRDYPQLDSLGKLITEVAPGLPSPIRVTDEETEPAA